MDRIINVKQLKGQKSHCDISITSKDKYNASTHVFDMSKIEALSLYDQLGKSFGTIISFEGMELDLQRYLEALDPGTLRNQLFRLLLRMDKQDIEFIKKQVLEYKEQYPSSENDKKLRKFKGIIK